MAGRASTWESASAARRMPGSAQRAYTSGFVIDEPNAIIVSASAALPTSVIANEQPGHPRSELRRARLRRGFWPLRWARGHRRRRAREDLPGPRPANRLAEGARYQAVSPDRVPRAARAAGRLLRRPQGRVLRDRGAQRLGQEHAAEDHGQYLPRRRGTGPDGGQGRPLHRARRRLQPRAERARERGPEWCADGAQPPRGAA